MIKTQQIHSRSLSDLIDISLEAFSHLSTRVVCFEEPKTKFFYHIDTNVWYEEILSKKRIVRYKGYLEPIPFEFTKEELKEAKIPIYPAYLLCRDGTWVNNGFIKVPSEDEQILNGLFSKKLKEAYDSSHEKLKGDFSLQQLFDILITHRN